MKQWGLSSPAHVSEILGSLSVQYSEGCEVLGGSGSVIACLTPLPQQAREKGLLSEKELRVKSIKSVLESQ